MDILSTLNPFYKKYFFRAVVEYEPRTRKEKISKIVQNTMMNALSKQIVLTIATDMKVVMNGLKIYYYFTSETDLFRFVNANLDKITEVSVAPTAILSLFKNDPHVIVRDSLFWGQYRYMMSVRTHKPENYERLLNALDTYFDGPDRPYVTGHQSKKYTDVYLVDEMQLIEFSLTVCDMIKTSSRIVLTEELDLHQRYTTPKELFSVA